MMRSFLSHLRRSHNFHPHLQVQGMNRRLLWTLTPTPILMKTHPHLKDKEVSDGDYGGIDPPSPHGTMKKDTPKL